MAAIAAEFPGWHIWRSRSARGTETGWHATRKHGGIVARLAAADAEGLREQLAAHEAREGAAA
jgi:hypothetical protein